MALEQKRSLDKILLISVLGQHDGISDTMCLLCSEVFAFVFVSDTRGIVALGGEVRLSFMSETSCVILGFRCLLFERLVMFGVIEEGTWSC